MTTLLLPLVVALFGSVLGAADRGWGTLRYLYVAPVSPRRLIIGKWSALTVCAALAIGVILLAGLAAGLAIFGWHPFHRIGAQPLSSAAAAIRLLGAAGYSPCACSASERSRCVWGRCCPDRPRPWAQASPP
jgi:ABC-2 type transport system permease protein